MLIIWILGIYQLDTTFNPMIERIRVVMKNIRANVTGSLKKIIAMMTVPTAPTPVQMT